MKNGPRSLPINEMLKNNAILYASGTGVDGKATSSQFTIVASDIVIYTFISAQAGAPDNCQAQGDWGA